MGLTDDEWGELQLTMATRSPVLVLGPGCHRVGYDRCRPWDDVVERMSRVWAELETMALASDTPAQCQLFLKHLWLGKLSDETIAGYHPFSRGQLPDDQDISVAPPDASTPIDRARTVLAASLLMVLYETTRCLGNVVATGASPVAHWSSVSHPGPFDGATGAAERIIDDAVDADVIRQLAIAHMDAVVKIATYLDAIRSEDPPGPQGEAVRREHALDFRPSEELKKQLTLLKMQEVKMTTEYLAMNYFATAGKFKLSGALVEWLADLFWHLIVTDSRVPPSQAELTFYLNLRATPDAETYGPREFTRARQGEPLSLRKPDRVSGDVRELLRTYDCGEQSWSDAARARTSLMATLSASLMTTWRARTPNSLPVIALVPGYDLSFERTLVEFLQDEEAVHVVVPVWHTSPARQGETGSATYLDWMFGTIDRPPGRVVQPTQLTQLSNWKWYQHQQAVADSSQRIRGPILVKLNGSPLLELNDVASLGLRKGETVQLATVFTEHDSLQAIVSFAEVDAKQAFLAEDVTDALDWCNNSWVFLGDSFPDWLPRVRLLFNAKSAWKSRPADGHIAIDRRFDWPEVGLLKALSVQTFSEDLANIAAYHRKPGHTAARDNPKVTNFLKAVAGELDAHARQDRR